MVYTHPVFVYYPLKRSTGLRKQKFTGKLLSRYSYHIQPPE
jgi:hypothetical protein